MVRFQKLDKPFVRFLCKNGENGIISLADKRDKLLSTVESRQRTWVKGYRNEIINLMVNMGSKRTLVSRELLNEIYQK